jgi:hypothetical protein
VRLAVPGDFDGGATLRRLLDSRRWMVVLIPHPGGMGGFDRRSAEPRRLSGPFGIEFGGGAERALPPVVSTRARLLGGAGRRVRASSRAPGRCANP